MPGYVSIDFTRVFLTFHLLLTGNRISQYNAMVAAKEAKREEDEHRQKTAEKDKANAGK